MLRKIIAASALVLALGGSAMAQSSDWDWSWWHHWGSSEQRPIDRTTTGSITTDRDTSGLNILGNTGAAGPCADNTAGPDANATGNVNDHYCGK